MLPILGLSARGRRLVGGCASPATSYDQTPMMDRRGFLLRAVSASLLATPHVAHAQRGRKVYRIGIIGNAPATADMVGPQPRSPFPGALLRGLRELGYVYGEHFLTEPRGAEGRAERYPEFAAELVRLHVDVIVAVQSALPALKEATSTIPVVMVGVSDPVGQGFVQSLGHPGGNFTGLSTQDTEVTGKRLELLKEVVPGPQPVAILWGHGGLWGQPGPASWQAATAAATERGWKLLSIELREAGDIEGAFKSAAAAGAGAVLMLTSGPFNAHARRLAEVAARSRLPVMYPFRFFVEAGGLMSYSADLVDTWRAAAVFVDKILRGAKPGNLSVEQPTKFELVINLKTAKALGLTIPPALLQRADQVIE
jgi:putative ABC transport system substrate-binding protein